MKTIKNIIFSRTDSIGDVVLTLPMAKALKDLFPHIYIGFMGKNYTKAVIEACEYVDEFIDVDFFLQEHILLAGNKPDCIIHVLPKSKIAKRAKHLKIPLRIGTTNRLYHWFTCNKLVTLSRKKSDLHEAQLNLKLLSALGVDKTYSLPEIAGMYGFTKLPFLEKFWAVLPDKHRYNLILHPKSQGNGREWGLDNFIQLIHLLDTEKYKIFISGTEKEKELLQPLFDAVGHKVTNLCGAINLAQFISFINACDGLVASGTGPLHVAAALGKNAFGIFPPVRPVHPGRWAPVGVKARFFVSDFKNESPENNSIVQLSPEVVKKAIEQSAISVSQTF